MKSTRSFSRRRGARLARPTSLLVILSLAGLASSADAASHALLVGVTHLDGERQLQLAGPGNDVELIRQALLARGVVDQTTLTNPTIDQLRDALSDSSRRVGRGDELVLYLSGFGYVVDDEFFFPAAGSPAPESGIDPTNDGSLSATEVSEFVASARNRGASVFVIVDACYAASLQILQRTCSGGWRVDGGIGGEGLCDYPAPPEAGGLTAFYASGPDGLTKEQEFSRRPGETVTYGTFTFSLAQALATTDTLTYRKLAEATLKEWRATHGTRPVEELPDTNVHRGLVKVAIKDVVLPLRGPVFEGTDPDAVALAPVMREANVLPAPENNDAAPARAVEIEVTSPPLDRGLDIRKVSTGRPTIRATVKPAEGLTALLVEGRAAEIGAGGEYESTIDLVSGLNEVVLLALYEDHFFHRDVVQLEWDGVSGDEAVPKGTDYVLAIGNNNYDDEQNYETLKTARKDAETVAKLLRDRLGFSSEIQLADDDGMAVPLNLVLLDANREQIHDALNALAQRLDPEDRLVIFYAGHGVAYEHDAYWLPKDAKHANFYTWISADEIKRALRMMKSKHVLVISDSCYAGAFARDAPPDLRDSETREEFLKKVTARRSRVVFTSGADEPVWDEGGGDHSVFAGALLRAFDEKLARKAPFTTHELVPFVKEAVAGNSEQLPQSSGLHDSGHDGGDFVFRPLPER